MRALSAAELLAVWECGLSQDYIGRAVSLLSAANPESSVAEIAELSIGRRDAALLTLRKWTFGPRIASVAVCPECGRNFELRFEADAIRASAEMETETQAGNLQFITDGIEVRIHLPNSVDLAAALTSQDLGEARRVMLRRCISANDASGNELEVEDLPVTVKEAAEEAMSKGDPQAEIRLAVCCADCGREWSEVFDVVGFFWTEIHAWAVRILREVHMLAAAYGWPERDILSMSPARRSFYLEMAGS